MIDKRDNHRRSTRLKEYDYSHPGAYFVTICTQNRECLFGDVADGIMVLNNAGLMIEKWLHELPNKFKGIVLGEYIIMPNHVHYIIENTGPVGADLCVCPRNPDKGEHAGSPLQKTVQWLKTMTTNEYIRNVKRNGWQMFNDKLWQRNYYEHVIRNEADLAEVREYILNNPARWNEDDYLQRGWTG
jgi:REP element-mobilizing transposase RayT